MRRAGGRAQALASPGNRGSATRNGTLSNVTQEPGSQALRHARKTLIQDPTKLDAVARARFALGRGFIRRPGREHAA